MMPGCPGVTASTLAWLPDRTQRAHPLRSRTTAGPVAARTVQGMARVRSGRLLPGPWFLTGGGAEAPTLKGWVPKMLSAKRFEGIFGCPLTVEGTPGH